MKHFAVVLIAAAISFIASAQNAENKQADAFQGTWKLNVAKSKFKPGPGAKSETVTITPDKVSVDAVDADGRTENWFYAPTAGGAATITGMENSSVTTTVVNNRTIEHTWKMGNSTMQGRGVVSKDGKKMTYTMTGTTPDGKPVHDVELFEKQ